MNKLLHQFQSKRTQHLFVVLMIVGFVVLSLIRLYPFENTLSEDVVGIDDWNKYARWALDIKYHGIFIPSLEENYWAPAGFLYNYFVAFCFTVFGDNTIPLFIIQSLFLGCSVAFIYFAFRDKMKPLTGFLFLLTLSFFALVDIYKYYTFRLLSENLALFTMSVFFYCFIKGMERNKLSLQLAAAFLLGVSVLIRPNIFSFEVILVVIAFFYYYKRNSGIKHFSLFITSLIVGTSFLLIRNYFITGDYVFLPTVGSTFGNAFLANPDFSVQHAIDKLLFFSGYLSRLEPDFRWRPHWTLMWIGYFIHIYYIIKDKRKLQLWETTSHLYLLSYYALLFLIAPTIGSYGYRLLIPAYLFALPFSFIGTERLLERRISPQQQ